jgi:hypothetical protein
MGTSEKEVTYSSSMFKMGKPIMVAERHGKLARHTVPGKTIPKIRRPEGTPGMSSFSSIPTVPCGTDLGGLAQPGTSSLANFQVPLRDS